MLKSPQETAASLSSIAANFARENPEKMKGIYKAVGDVFPKDFFKKDYLKNQDQKDVSGYTGSFIKHVVAPAAMVMLPLIPEKEKKSWSSNSGGPHSQMEAYALRFGRNYKDPEDDDYDPIQITEEEQKEYDDKFKKYTAEKLTSLGKNLAEIFKPQSDGNLHSAWKNNPNPSVAENNNINETKALMQGLYSAWNPNLNARGGAHQPTHIMIGTRRARIYYGPRGGKYVRIRGKLVPISKIKREKNYK